MDLTYNSPIRAAAWGDIFVARVFTTKGYAAANGRDVQEAIERSKRHGHALVGSIYIGVALLGDRAESARRNAELRETVAQALTVKTGDRVTIDGAPYTVRFAQGNEKAYSPRNSDPVHFVPVAG